MTYDIIGQNYDTIGQNYDIMVSTKISGVPRFQMEIGVFQQGWSPLTDLTWQQPVGFVAVSDAGLTSVAIIPSLGLAPFALAAPIQAPLAPQLWYASVAKSAAYQAVSGPELTAKKKSFSGC